MPSFTFSRCLYCLLGNLLLGPLCTSPCLSSLKMEWGSAGSEVKYMDYTVWISSLCFLDVWGGFFCCHPRLHHWPLSRECTGRGLVEKHSAGSVFSSCVAQQICSGTDTGNQASHTGNFCWRVWAVYHWGLKKGWRLFWGLRKSEEMSTLQKCCSAGKDNVAWRLYEVIN